MRELYSGTCSLGGYCAWISSAGLKAAAPTNQRDLFCGTGSGRDAFETGTSWSSLSGSSSSVCGGVAECFGLRRRHRQALTDGQQIWYLKVLCYRLYVVVVMMLRRYCRNYTRWRFRSDHHSIAVVLNIRRGVTCCYECLEDFIMCGSGWPFLRETPRGHGLRKMLMGCSTY
jgi:hypothetical protein